MVQEYEVFLNLRCRPCTSISLPNLRLVRVLFTELAAMGGDEGSAACAILTIQLHDCVTYGVHNSFNGSNTGNVPVKNVEGSKIPTGEPDENVVPSGEQPKKR